MAKIGSIGPYSKPAALAKLDGRRREVKLMQQTRAELTAHVGGEPNAVQRALIDRAVVLRLRLEMMDAQAGANGAMREKIAREYLCWNNAYMRMLAQLGLDAAEPPGPTLDDIVADVRRQQPQKQAV